MKLGRQCHLCPAAILLANRTLPEKSSEKITHKLHGPKTITCLVGHFSFAFTSFFIKDIGQFLVTHKQAQDILKFILTVRKKNEVSRSIIGISWLTFTDSNMEITIFFPLALGQNPGPPCWATSPAPFSLFETGAH